LPCAIGPLSVLSRLSVCSLSNAGVLWPSGWMDQDETWHGGRPQPRHIVLDGAPNFQPMSVVTG